MQVKPGLAQWDAYRRAVLHPPEGTKDGKPMSRTTALLAQLNDIRLKALLGASEKDLTPLLYATLGLIADRLAAGKQTMVASPFREFSIALGGAPRADRESRPSPHLEVARLDLRADRHRHHRRAQPRRHLGEPA